MLSNEVFDKVYTIVKSAMQDIETEVNGEVVPKWATLNFARSWHELETAKLPCLLIQQIGAPQVANDLMRNVQNAVDSTFQIQGVANSYDEAYQVINDAGDIFIELGYALTFGVQEIQTNTPSIWRFVARFNRIVGGLDNLKL